MTMIMTTMNISHVAAMILAAMPPMRRGEYFSVPDSAESRFFMAIILKADLNAELWGNGACPVGFWRAGYSSFHKLF